MAAAMSKSHSFIGGKRRRDAVDEVYFDNYHNQKRYLTEVMASSMNGLSVSDLGGVTRQPSSPVDPMLSATFSETVCTVSKSASSVISHGDESSTLDSLMSEHSDESVGYRSNRGLDTITTDLASSNLVSSCSPSPRRFQRLPCHGSGKFLPGSLNWIPSRLPSSPYTPSCWPRLHDTEDRLPGSPNDLSQTGDLRRATLIRNLSLRAQLLAQPISSPTAVSDKEASKHLEEQDFVEEGGDQSSPNSMDYVPQQVGCTVPPSGSPTHAVFPSHAVRGSPRVRSLVLGESKVTPKAVMSTVVSIPNKVDKVIAIFDQQSRLDGESSYSRSPTSPLSPKTVASSGYEISSSPSSMDGNTSDTESSFSRRSVTLTSLCRRPLGTLGDDSRFPVMEAMRPIEPPDWIN